MITTVLHCCNVVQQAGGVRHWDQGCVFVPKIFKKLKKFNRTHERAPRVLCGDYKSTIEELLEWDESKTKEPILLKNILLNSRK